MRPISPQLLLSLSSVLVGLAASVATGVCADDVGYQKEASVREPTRLDWIFAVANQSRIDPPKEWLGDYDSGRQKYELFVPISSSTPKSASVTRPQARKKPANEV